MGVEWDGTVRREQRTPERRNPLNFRLALFLRVLCLLLAPVLSPCLESPWCLLEGISDLGSSPSVQGPQPRKFSSSSNDTMQVIVVINPDIHIEINLK